MDQKRWELNQGDYPEEDRVFDHVTSTGMVSHVGPRGLVPYVKSVRQRIKTGGRYVHQALTTGYTRLPLDFAVGVAFNKQYVWSGFHWFAFSTHVKALEQNGFSVLKAVNLSGHYAKTTNAWYERMMDQQATIVSLLGETSFRAWRIYLAGAVGGLAKGRLHVYRLYCVTV